MVINAKLTQHDELVYLDLYPGERRPRATDNPNLEDYEPKDYIWFYWDDEKLDRGEYEFLGVEVDNIAKLTAEDRRALDRVAPRIDLPALGLPILMVSDVLLRIQQAFARRSVSASLRR